MLLDTRRGGKKGANKESVDSFSWAFEELSRALDTLKTFILFILDILKEKELNFSSVF